MGTIQNTVSVPQEPQPSSAGIAFVHGMRARPYWWLRYCSIKQRSCAAMSPRRVNRSAQVRVTKMVAEKAAKQHPSSFERGYFSYSCISKMELGALDM
jgi:hypothetical protein